MEKAHISALEGHKRQPCSGSPHPQGQTGAEEDRLGRSTWVWGPTWSIRMATRKGPISHFTPWQGLEAQK